MPFGRGCASLGKITLPLCGRQQEARGPTGGPLQASLLGENKIIERSEMGAMKLA